MSNSDSSGQLNQEPSGQAIAFPLVSLKRFSELSGISIGVLRGWINKGYIPTYAVGKYSLINLAALTEMALKKGSWL